MNMQTKLTYTHVRRYDYDQGNILVKTILQDDFLSQKILDFVSYNMN